MSHSLKSESITPCFWSGQLVFKTVINDCVVQVNQYEAADLTKQKTKTVIYIKGWQLFTGNKRL